MHLPRSCQNKREEEWSQAVSLSVRCWTQQLQSEPREQTTCEECFHFIFQTSAHVRSLLAQSCIMWISFPSDTRDLCWAMFAMCVLPCVPGRTRCPGCDWSTPLAALQWPTTAWGAASHFKHCSWDKLYKKNKKRSTYPKTARTLPIKLLWLQSLNRLWFFIWNTKRDLLETPESLRYIHATQNTSSKAATEIQASVASWEYFSYKAAKPWAKSLVW